MLKALLAKKIIFPNSNYSYPRRAITAHYVATKSHTDTHPKDPLNLSDVASERARPFFNLNKLNKTTVIGLKFPLKLNNLNVTGLGTEKKNQIKRRQKKCYL